MARQSQTSPRSGLGIGNPQGCARSGRGSGLPFKAINKAGFRQKEVRFALDTAMEKPEGEIFIIPARLEECDNLESLRKWHWVDLFEDDGYEMLMRALQSAGK